MPMKQRLLRVRRLPRPRVERKKHRERSHEHAERHSGCCNLRRNRYVIAARGQRMAHRACKNIGPHDHVGVGEYEYAAGCSARAAFERVILAEPSRGQFIDAHHREACVARRFAREDNRRRVIRTVVDDDHLIVRVILREQRVERGFDAARLIARRDHHGHARRPCGQRRWNIAQEPDRPIAAGPKPPLENATTTRGLTAPQKTCERRGGPGGDTT